MKEQNRPQIFKVYYRDAISNDHVVDMDPYWETIITRDEKRNIYRVFEWCHEDPDDSPIEIPTYEYADMRLNVHARDILASLGAFSDDEINRYNLTKDKRTAESRRLNDIAKLNDLAKQYPEETFLAIKELAYTKVISENF